MSKFNPQIWAGCQAAYNSGHLHGKWIDATQEEDDIWTEIKAMLAESPVSYLYECEEWYVGDTQDFNDVTIGTNVSKISEIAQAIKKYGEGMSIFLKHGCEISNFESSYKGCYKSEQDFVYKEWEKSGKWGQLKEIGVEEWAINLQALENNWFTSGYWSETDSEGCHIFYG
ncbi:MAG: antirestriction protein ArdA [Microcystaceae cyanobacterium]